MNFMTDKCPPGTSTAGNRQGSWSDSTTQGTLEEEKKMLEAGDVEL